MTGPTDIREAFWGEPPTWPAGLKLIRREAVVVPQPGPTGSGVYDWAELVALGEAHPLLLAIRPTVLARDVAPLKARLHAVLDEDRRRSLAAGRPLERVAIPALVVDRATPSLIETCLREALALFDRRGTVIVHRPSLFVHVEGKGMVATARTSRARLFSGKAARLVRILLTRPHETFTAQAIAAAADTSYVHAHGVLTQLESLAFVARRSPRSGFYLRDAGGLLRAWVDSGQRTAAAVETFYAPSTRPEALARVSEVCAAVELPWAFTYASALQPEEVFVAGLPHGLYFAGDLEPLVGALSLRRSGPQNFHVLRPEAAAQTPAGGVFSALRPLPFGGGVSLPQLAADFAGLPGRGREQALSLVSRYVDALGPAPERP